MSRDMFEIRREIFNDSCWIRRNFEFQIAIVHWIYYIPVILSHINTEIKQLYQFIESKNPENKLAKDITPAKG